jgi:dihydropyrimidinase
LQILATNYGLFCFNENLCNLHRSKQQGRANFEKIHNGALGVELRLSLLFDGGVRIGEIYSIQVMQLTSTAPAKIGRLFSRKGAIVVGCDLDIVLSGSNKQHTISTSSTSQHYSTVDYSLWYAAVLSAKSRKRFWLET